MSPAGLPWSAEQQRLLAAMGYALYALRVPVAGAPAAASASAPASTSASAPPPVRATVEVDFDDPLFPALIRAAGLSMARPSEFDWLGWAQAVGLPPLAELRRDPQAKRALWPRLRRWRRERARR